ncbi:MAG: tetratricopeptide repeat protein, partial [Planctomycetota bacterium]
ENLGIRNPIGSGPSTVPQSSISGGLVRTPDPIDTAGNLLMTGNVRRGMHFRGNVPYQSPTSFGSTLGSSSLSSFLRDTAGPEDIRSQSQRFGAQPYYSATETVTTTRPGRAEVISPTSAMINTRMQRDPRATGTAVFGLDAPLAEPMSFGRVTAAPGLDLHGRQTPQNFSGESRLAPDGSFSQRTSVNPRDVRELTSGRVGIGREGEMSAVEQSRDRNLPSDGTTQIVRPERFLTTEGPLQYSSPGVNVENFGSETPAQMPAEPVTDWPDIREQLRTDGDKLLSESYGDLAKRDVSGVAAGPAHTSVAPGGLSSQDSFGQSQRDVLERLRQQLEVLTRSVETSLQSMPGGLDTIRTEGAEPGSASGLYDSQRLTPGFGDSEPGRVEREAGLGFPETAGGMDSQDKTSVLNELGQMSRAEIATEARRIMGPHTGLESLSDAKFSKHIRAAEEHLRAGRYYRAVDSFALAAVYEPDHPAVLAGKSHALFAAGEYMSSSLFLSRTLSVLPEYAQVEVDLVALLGGQDKIARRLADIEQWYARSGSGQLQFLLSYVYYRMGRLAEAKRAIEAANQKMPQLPAVRTMKTAIEGAAR